MERHLYRVFFTIMNAKKFGVSTSSVQEIKKVLIEIPDAYMGTELQVKIFEKQAFIFLKEKKVCFTENTVHYTGNEIIPNIPKTKDMKPDIIIESADWN